MKIVNDRCASRTFCKKQSMRQNLYQKNLIIPAQKMDGKSETGKPVGKRPQKSRDTELEEIPNLNSGIQYGKEDKDLIIWDTESSRVTV